MNEATVKFIMLAALDFALMLIVAFAALPTVLVPHEALWQPEKVNLTLSSGTQCQDSGTSDCVNSQGCPGHRTCIEGQWSICIIHKICTPGEKSACFVDSCATGYKTCDSCGTGYGSCSGQ
ncbi:Uncharacterised protein [uncultured archaeon]|nr:Uncharacterised protein [uncultured archaeon]